MRQDRLPGSTVSGTVTWPTLQEMLRSIRGEQKMIVTYYGEAASPEGERVALYHVVADSPVALEQFAHVVGQPRETEVDQDRAGASSQEMASNLAALGQDEIDDALRAGGFDPEALRQEAGRRQEALAAVKAFQEGQPSPGPSTSV